MSDPRSDALFREAEVLLPGGVNSPVRAFRAVGGHPVFVERALGARIFGADGHEYIDYIGSWGPAILGHAEPHVVEAVQRAAASGLSFGAPTEREVRFARAVIERYPSIEMLRCVSSGTEATMSALRVARGYTKRSVIVKFDGGYHGHSDALLVKAGSGAATFGNPDSAGVPEGMVATTATLPYNDVSALKSLFSARGREIAAVIVEPVAGNMGCVPPAPGFLAGIIELCEAHGALAIFDEVMTGSRLSRGGAQGLYGLRPHMTCLGKVIGGGMPLAAYGGSRQVMQCVAPLGPVYQAGTLSGNPLAVTAGLVTLERLDAPGSYERLEALGARLEAGMASALRETGTSGCVQRVGSMLTLFFHPGPVTDFRVACAADTARFSRFHGALLAGGVYWPPSQFEAAFLSLAHTEADIDRTIGVVRTALERSRG
ncbi:MAG TPA: glutamate-1-semialdehyde 2,1-aminomutase [Polyangiaceae bacterium]|nr:glutamate-1-semialdehyde 2,1-aminomutase [Polyangiaceae bacterium]